MVYSKWVPYLLEGSDFNKTLDSKLLSGDKFKDGYTTQIFAESMVINVLGAALVGLVIVMPILVLHPKFRFRPQRIITVTHDRYG